MFFDLQKASNALEKILTLNGYQTQRADFAVLGPEVVQSERKYSERCCMQYEDELLLGLKEIHFLCFDKNSIL